MNDRALSKKNIEVMRLIVSGEKAYIAYRKIYGKQVALSSAKSLSSRIKKKYELLKATNRLSVEVNNAIKGIAKEEGKEGKELFRAKVNDTLTTLVEEDLLVFDLYQRKLLMQRLIINSLNQYQTMVTDGYNIVEIIEKRGNEIVKKQTPTPMDIIAMLERYERLYGSIERVDNERDPKMIEIVLMGK